MPHKTLYEISDKNKKAVDKYIKNRVANGKDNIDTNNLLETSIRKVLSLLDKNFNEITPNDLDNVFSLYNSSSTREVQKSYFKSFLKYHNLDDLANHIKINFKHLKESPYSDDDVLTTDEINKIRDSELSIRDKAIFELFITTGIRRGEFINLKYQNIEIKEDEIIIHITKGGTKGKKRNISIIPYEGNPTAFYPSNFVSYYNNHIFKNQPDKPLFYSVSSNTQLKELNPISLTLFFNKVRDVSKVDKKITPHILRHTTATNDGYFLTPEKLRLKFGWSKNSNMMYRYCHLNEKGLSDDLKRLAGITQETTNNAKCPYCGTINNLNDINCKTCKRIIKYEEVIKERDKLKRTRELDRIHLKNELNKMREDINFTIQYFEDITNKRIFIVKNRDLIKKKILESGVGKLHREGKISKDEFIDRETAIIDKLYESYKPNIKINTVDDLRKFRNNMRGLVKELIS